MSDQQASGTFVDVAATSEIPAGEVRGFEHKGQRVSICNTGETFYAVEDCCTHDDGPLGDGELDGCAIECPRHGARFDIRTGEVLQMPAVFPIKTFETRIENGRVLVKLEEA